MTGLTAVLSAAETRPAGGAALGEVLLATALGLVLTALLLGLVWVHRTRRWSGLTTAGNVLGRATRVPAWVALPTILATGSLLVALFGMMWDISLHIDVGRDPGPLANPAHYFILFGLFGVFSAGVLACAMPLGEKPGPVAVHFLRGWDVPVGGVLLTASGFYALLGFPLDDIWHRIFGQDVTLWGPTHLMLIGGAAMTLVGIAVLSIEGMRANAAAAIPIRELVHTRLARAIALTGGLMLGLSTFQAEFDFGVPPFQVIFQPMLLMIAAGVGLVLARVYAGRGAALGAALFFIVLRSGLAILVGPVLGQTTPHFPLYLVEAVVVEAAALFVTTKRPFAFGLASGVGIGTVGLAAEWAWSHIWMPLPWPDAACPEAALLAFPAAVAGASLGAWIGAPLSPEPLAERSPLLR